MTQQVVLITGALTGIGRATAVAFANKGANVVVSGRHDDKGQALVAELKALGAEAEFVRADVTKEDDESGARERAWLEPSGGDRQSHYVLDLRHHDRAQLLGGPALGQQLFRDGSVSR